jgi:hypothetical protein
MPGTLDTGMFAVGGMSDGNLPFGGTALSGDFARGISTGGVTTGGMYAFDLGGGDMALGFQPTESDMTPGVLMARVDNATGEVITALEVSYEIVVYNDENRATSWSFAWALNEAGPFTTISELDFTTTQVADSIPSFSSTRCLTLITDLAVADGASIYLRWQTDDVSGDGARDEIGINNLVLRGTQVLLADGFENGDTSAWSTTVS